MEYMVARVVQQQHAAHASHSCNNTMMPHQPLPQHLAPPPLQQAGPPGQHRPPPPVSQRTRGSATMKQQARLALEQEVAELRQHLSNEQAVHDILERALQPGAGRSVVMSSIPAFIPGKAKELLAELVLVEEEIARLETHIHEMKGGLTVMQQQRVAMTQTHSPSLSPRPSAVADVHPPPPRKVAPAPEMKSMFFITQAMDHLAGAGGGAADDKASNKDRSPRHSSNTFSRNSLEKPPKHELPIVTKSPKNKLQPNKLSERIVKCLVCIFIRLLRSSRAAELERSSAGSAARSGGTNSHQLQGSFSFRIDAGLSLAAKEKQERGQQDHYGIFGIQDAIVRDIGPYKNLVRFTSSSFDLRGFSTSPLLTKLREMLEALQQVDLRFLSYQQKLAFWLNIYNTCIMHGILQHGLPSNSERLLALKNKATINVSGQKFNALVIENFILRQPSSVKEEFWKCDVDVEEQEVRGLYGLKNSEPNILFALCCGIRSSPALRIYKADRVVADLEKAKLEYLQASLVVTSTRRLMIPSLVHSNMHDFAKDMESLVRWVCDQLPTSWSLRKSMVDCLRGQMHLKQVEEVVDVIPFDYEFQYLLPM